MPQQPPPFGADGEPDGHLLPPRQRPDQQQAADIRTRDQEHKKHYRKCDLEHGTQLTRLVEWRFPQRQEPDVTTAVRRHIIRFQTLCHSGNLLLRLLSSHSRLKARETFNPKLATILQFVSARLKYLLHRNWNPELDWPAHKGAVKPFRRYANNRVLHTVEQLRLPDDFSIAMEALFPHPVTDHGHGMGVASRFLGGSEAPPQPGTDAERVKIIRRNDASGHAFGLVPKAERSSHDFVGNEVDKFAVVPEIDEFGPRDIRIGPACCLVAGDAIVSDQDEQPVLVGYSRERT